MTKEHVAVNKVEQGIQLHRRNTANLATIQKSQAIP